MQGQHINSAFFIDLPSSADLFWRVSIILLALVLDFLFGSFFPKFLPSLLRSSQKLGAALKTRLDKPTLSRRERFYRGIAIGMILLVFATAIGFLIENFLPYNVTTAAALLFLILPLISQRAGWRQLTLGRASPGEHARNADRLVQVILNFSGKMVPLSLAFIVGGFVLLLPALLILGLFSRSEEIPPHYPQSPYSLGTGLLHEVFLFIPSWIASCFITLAAACLPFTKMSAAGKLLIPATKGLPSTYFPLNIIATGVEICFRIQGSKSVEWIGPETGRAKIQPDHLRAGMLCIIGANILYLISGILLFLYLASLLAR